MIAPPPSRCIARFVRICTIKYAAHSLECRSFFRTELNDSEYSVSNSAHCLETDLPNAAILQCRLPRQLAVRILPMAMVL